MSRRQELQTKRLIEITLGELRKKLNELILKLEDVEAQEEFAEDVGEKKALVQEIIVLTHQIQALKTVIKIFAGKE